MLECLKSAAALPMEVLNATFIGIFFSVPYFVGHVFYVLVHILYLLFVLEDGLRDLA